VRHGRGFRYLDPDGEAVTDDEVVARIHELVIPPAWQEVWICPYPGGHIQATGVDQAGRKQYLYHPRWRERRDQAKFDDMVRFARALPALREQVDAALEPGDLSREHVLAVAVRLLEISAKDFRTWGATVLAAVALAVSGKASATKTGRTRAVSRAVKEVAHYLGNTPAVARASYIDPRVFDRFREGRAIDSALVAAAGGAAEGTAIQGPVEEAVLDLLG
jgi:DNA topoisomerase IB